MRAGTETQIVRLALWLRAHGEEVGVLSILPTAAFADELAAGGVPIAHVRLHPRLRSVTAMVSGWRILRAWRPEVLVSFGFQANMLGRVAGALAGVPVRISSLRNERFGGRARELLTRATSFLAATTTTNSERAAAAFVRRRVVPAARLAVIPNSVDRAVLEAAAGERESARRELGIDDATFLWLAMGRLHPQKDYATLLSAFARLLADHPAARLRIAGQGRLHDALVDLIEDLGLTETVELLGLRADAPRLLAAADALVLSSAWEGLPNVVLEAMVTGLPVVATSVGGVPELVDDGRTGRLVPPRDVGALAGAMGDVMAADSPTRAAMGARARAAVDDRFSPDAVGARWLELIDACSARRRSLRDRMRALPCASP